MGDISIAVTPPSPIGIKAGGKGTPSINMPGTIQVSSDKNYTHHQEIAAAEWDVEHGLGKYPAVSAFDSAGTQMYVEVLYVSLNHVKLLFTAATSGYATFN